MTRSMPPFDFTLLDVPTDPEAVKGIERKRSFLEWGVALNGWGDTLVALGNFLHMSREGHGGIILYSQDKYLAEFVRKQRFVDEVGLVNPLDMDEWQTVVEGLGTGNNPEAVLAHLANRAGIVRTDPSTILNTAIDPTSIKNNRIYRWTGAVAQPTSDWIHWTYQHQDRRIDPPYILLHPYSFNSCSLEQHWPYWQFALKWILENTNYKIVLTGKNWEASSGRDRVINLLDKTRSMEDVFWLANYAEAVVTTSCSLSVWGVIQNIPTVVCANELLGEGYFRRWISSPNVNIVPFKSEPLDFVPAFGNLVL